MSTGHILTDTRTGRVFYCNTYEDAKLIADDASGELVKWFEPRPGFAFDKGARWTIHPKWIVDENEENLKGSQP